MGSIFERRPRMFSRAGMRAGRPLDVVFMTLRESKTVRRTDRVVTITLPVEWVRAARWVPGDRVTLDYQAGQPSVLLRRRVGDEFGVKLCGHGGGPATARMAQRSTIKFTYYPEYGFGWEPGRYDLEGVAISEAGIVFKMPAALLRLL